MLIKAHKTQLSSRFFLGLLRLLICCMNQALYNKIMEPICCCTVLRMACLSLDGLEGCGSSQRSYSFCTFATLNEKSELC